MQRLVDFIHCSLDLLPQPAALYTADGEFVDRNIAASGLITQLIGHEPTQQEILEFLGTRDLLARAREDGTAEGRGHGYMMYGTLIEPYPSIPRPPLVLLSMHQGVSDGLGQLDHQRIVLMVKVNEQCDMAQRILETVQIQITALAKSSWEATMALNEHTRAVLGAHYSKV